MYYPSASKLYSGWTQERTQEKEVWPPIVEGQFLPVHPVWFRKVEMFSTAGVAKYPKFDGGSNSYAEFRFSKRAYCNYPHILGATACKLSKTQAQLDSALVMALSRIDDQKFDVGLFLAELPETCLLLRNPLQSLAKLTNRWLEYTKVYYDRGVRKSSRRYKSRKLKRRDFAEAASSTWLTARYGIVPVLLDIDALAYTAAGLAEKNFSTVYSAHGANSTERRASLKNSSSLPLSGLTYTPWRQTEGKIWEKLTVAYCVRYRFRPEMEQAAQLAAWGLSPTQAASLLYQATPLSFVLDWVTNFGDWIKAMEPKPHIEIIDYALSERKTLRMTFNDTGGSYRYATNAIPAGITGYARVDELLRVNATHHVVAPKPRLRSNGVKLLQILDGLSLINQPIIKGLSKWV